MSGDDMTRIPGGRFRMGSERFYTRKQPVREVQVGELCDRPWANNGRAVRALHR